jgi:rubrerythrin
MTDEEAIKNLKKLKSFHNGSYGTAIDLAIKALEQQPCEDAISRKAVLSLFNKSDEYRWETTWIRRKIEKLPSVIPIIPKGKWKPLNYKDEMWGYVYECSNCGAIDYGNDYCPNCGAKMEAESEE